MLGLQRVANKEAIKFRLPAVEGLDLVRSLQLFHAHGVCHGSASKTEGSRNSRSRRGLRCGGASSAVTKASHFFSSSVKTFRSANRSSASLSAVSRTNSLTIFGRTSPPLQCLFRGLAKAKVELFRSGCSLNSHVRRLPELPDNVKTICVDLGTSIIK